jgi:hypothetical protein
MGEGVEHDGDPLRRAFAPLIGLAAWSVRKGHGSFLTFEFGTPHLVTREPVAAKHDTSERVRKSLARRRVYPAGEWHIWIYCCNWRVWSEGAEMACSESPDDKIVAAADDIDGQLLMDVIADPKKGTSKFTFDQGSLLETWPWDDGNEEQWMLYMNTNDVFSYRADGCYQTCPKDGNNDDLGWRPLRSTYFGRPFQ